MLGTFRGQPVDCMGVAKEWQWRGKGGGWVADGVIARQLPRASRRRCESTDPSKGQPGDIKGVARGLQGVGKQMVS